MREAPTTGSDCRVVLLWVGTRINLDRVSAFSARQVVDTQTGHPFNADPMTQHNPAGWQGRIVCDRFGREVDKLFNNVEQAFRNSGGQPWIQQTATGSGIPPGTIYAYINEPDGSVTTFEFSGVSAYLSDAGEFRMGQVVRQTIEFVASARTII